jgi:uncharacterized cupin superfamily protein
MKPLILNIAAIELMPWGHGAPFPGAGHASERYQARIGALSLKLGAQKLGYNLTVVPPGKSAFPFHCHSVNEEMFFILEGTGEIRLRDGRHAIVAGDVIACPPGGPATAHQIVNTSPAELKFLAISTQISPEICEYPDTGRFGLMAEMPPGADGKPRDLRFVGRPDETLDYWQGE